MHGHVPATEGALRSFEASVIEEAREWGLDWHASGGRLAALELLAAMQHYGAPTRLLDFTFNPLIALWFAVESDAAADGRVFAIDIYGRRVTPGDAELRDPWWLRIGDGSTTDWTTRPWIWQPPPLEARMVRQEGCFVMGGVPSTIAGRRLGTRMLSADDPGVHECAVSADQVREGGGSREGRTLPGWKPKSRAFTLLVRNKSAVRESLVQMFGYSYRSLFPDYLGFGRHGVSWRQ